jgi:hypothetical protein
MKGQKVGRNDPCPCGNGKKYKKCHVASLTKTPSPEVSASSPRTFRVRSHAENNVPPDVLARVQARFREDQAKEQERIRLYGHVRPEIAMDYSGSKFVAIGGTLIYIPSDRCRFLTDVLLAYVPQLFGREWFEGEIAKQPEKRHPVMQWRIKGMNYMNAQPQLPDGSYGATPTGPLLAYITFAYDLYVVAHNGGLDKRLVERLKQMDQFQGARHELFAEATCLRAGFSVEHEDEKDRLSRHAEFTATHKATGQQISVEAKSKHRPGILGRPGTREASDGVDLPFGYMLNKAVDKNPKHPLVVFLDMNMSFETASRFLTHPLHPFIRRTFDRMRKRHGGKDPITLSVITNHPGHYTKDNEIPNWHHLVAQISQLPSKPARMEALMAVVQATQLYGNIPQELPKPRDGKL